MKRKLQVFISSTFTDMLEERQAAVETILRAGHLPAGMELFTAGDQSQMQVIKRWIDESDVYLLILGGRYGSIEETTGLSYIELEYDYASEQGKPMFAVVINEDALDEKVKKSGKEVVELSAGSALEQFKSKVLSKVSSFYSDVKDLRLAIFHSLTEYAADPELKGWIRGDEAHDVQPLLEEIERLKAENSALNENLKAQKNRKPSGFGDFEEILEILDNAKVTIPSEALNGQPETETTLLQIFLGSRDNLINGVTNAYNANEAETFLYFNISPKLATHGLMDNEKVAGAKYRRSYVTKEGLAFLAEFDRRLNANKKRDKKPQPKGAAASKKPKKGSD